jgi:hypothetical protein
MMMTTKMMMTMRGGSPWTVVADAAKAAADLILARRAWAVAARYNDRDNNGKEGNPLIPNDATAGSGGDNNNASSAVDNGIVGCLRVLNKEMTLLQEALAAEKHKLLTKLMHRRVAGQLLFQPL